MSYRVEFGAGAQVQCAVELADRPWDAAIRPPGNDHRFRETLFDSGHGTVGFYLDEDAELVRIFDIMWIA